jgi:hypothetical protein
MALDRPNGHGTSDERPERLLTLSDELLALLEAMGRLADPIGRLNVAFAAFEARHFAGITPHDREPAEYVREAEEGLRPPAGRIAQHRQPQEELTQDASQSWSQVRRSVSGVRSARVG